MRAELLRRPADALVFPAVPAGHDGHRPARSPLGLHAVLQGRQRRVRRGERHVLRGRHDDAQRPRGHAHLLQEIRRVLPRPSRPGLGRGDQLPGHPVRRRVVDGGRGAERAGAHGRSVSLRRPGAGPRDHAPTPGRPDPGGDAGPHPARTHVRVGSRGTALGRPRAPRPAHPRAAGKRRRVRFLRRREGHRA